MYIYKSFQRTSLLFKQLKRSLSMEAAKKAAAYEAVNKYVTKETKYLGVGSGSTIVYAVERLAQRVKEEDLNIKCIPTSFQSRQLILDNGLVLSDIQQHPELDIVIDGADEVDVNLNCIKGGGGCLTQEKIVASCAKNFVIIADSTKRSQHLGDSWKNGVAVEVIPMAYSLVIMKLKQLGFYPSLRMAKAKTGPLVTDNGNFIIDFKFDKLTDCKIVNDSLISIPGIVETGLFIEMANSVIFGFSDGTTEEIFRQ
ncbi:ribose-5-phosphate isomerase [Hydra vulgaris]|uniref:ribose-5-phosphate isomerase n=1 Tax=Hydra vulgaris TaxID=6087 RepID=UPI001F5E41A0|nr:ribose-5-phosphate isomerase-like [Hydra vulgaris]